MNTSRTSRLVVASTALLLLGAACERDNQSTDGPLPNPADHEVFLDEFGPNLDFAAFGDSDVYALSIEYQDTYRGDAAIRITVPPVGGVNGSYAGGSFVTTNSGRDLSGYNALTFYVKASIQTTMGVIGIGNNNQGTSIHTAEMTDIAVGTGWQRVVIPLPLPSVLTQEQGLFHFAVAPQDGNGFNLWMDEIQFESLDSISNPRPVLAGGTYDAVPGSSVVPSGSQVTFSIDGQDRTIGIMPAYFTYTSTDPAVALPQTDGSISILTNGNATISARLGTVDAEGVITVVATSNSSPTAPPPFPLQPASEVQSLFSDAYPDAATIDWTPDWNMADVEDITLQGNAIKLFTNLTFAGIDFSASLLDVSAATYLHLDIFTLEPNDFRIKLVDFGADGAYQGGDDSEHEVILTTATFPAMVEGDWSTLDIPLAQFSGLTSVSHLSQIILAGGSSTLWLDNLYFHQDPLPTAPTVAAPLPQEDPAGVISLYSNAYTNTPVDSWSADWDSADTDELQIEEDAVRRYTNLTVAGIEFLSQPVDAAAMNAFHLDLWTGDAVAGATFRVKLVDLGADGLVGTGDDSEHELSVSESTTPALVSGTWIRLDLLLQNFTGLTERGHLGQLILSSDQLDTIFVDNIYFYDQANDQTSPQAPAPTPTQAPSEVISLFSDAYSNVHVDTWSAGWDNADLVDTDIDGDSLKLYTNFVVAGIEFTTSTLDISDKSHFHMDIWTPDPTAMPTAFKVKLVDFGPNGVWEGPGVLDDTEHELSINAAYTTPLATGSWVSLDLPLADFTGLVTRQHTAQLILSGGLHTVYIDNVYFHGTGGGGLNVPATPAPDPAWAAGDVISLFSDSYTNVPVDSWSANWPDEADVAQIEIEGNAVKLYTSLVYAGIEFTSQTIDATTMTHFHLDLWTPDATAAPADFWIKLVDFGANGVWGGGDDSEHQLHVDASSATPLATGSWVSLDLPLAQFSGLTARGHLAQLLIGSGIEGSPFIDTVFIDNVLLHR
ncbi:MAG: hypothetical protein KC518_03075 [Candidatus Cloacimonetes bacterium]|nr:hypothetical protein [Candidatus Cloacimonadota bacterium]